MLIWKNILNQLKAREKVMLLFVASHQGSSPGKQGFKMMVAEDGSMEGSIGGGITEFNLVEKAKSLMVKNEKHPLFVKQVHRTNEPDSSGMICAGEQTVIIYPIKREFIPSIEKIIEEKKGLLTIAPNDFELSQSYIQKNTFNFFKKDEKSWEYKEIINHKPHLYIIGGGHVGFATSQLFKLLDFEITLLDCRKQLNTFEENTFADYKRIIDYQNIGDYIPKGNNSYIVVMTHKYEDDKLIISSLNPDNYRYIGLLGSKSKVKILFDKLIAEGFDKADLKKIDAPIGMPINSITPDEIAVSIAAKIIAVKNQ